MNITDNSAIRCCTSCQLCAAICNHNAISIELNPEGFYRPKVDEKLCIDCGFCTKICYKFDHDIMITNRDQLNDKPLFSAWSNEAKILKHTTSGGIADLLARELIKQGYKVVGVVYNDDKACAEHKIASTLDETLEFRGSKYIQSYTLCAMEKVIKNCRSEKYAIFGTPCQIYALNKIATIRRVRDQFIFVDLYCHGCPSLHVWTKYQTYIKQKVNIYHFDRVEFRSKVKGWGGFYVVSIESNNKQIFKSSPFDDGFYELFFSDQVLNDSCNDCLLRNTLEYTDIRLGDFWGKKFLSNHKGVSAVTIATKNGFKVFNKIKDSITCDLENYNEFFPFQCWGKTHRVNPKIRKNLLSSLMNEHESINDAVRVLRKQQSINGKIKRYVNNILYYQPLWVKKNLKKLLI